MNKFTQQVILSKTLKEFFPSGTIQEGKQFIASFGQKGFIHVQEPEQLKDKLLHIKKGGQKNLQILSDYDDTISQCYYHDGKTKADSSFRALIFSRFLTDATRLQFQELFKFYGPIELSSTITPEEKIAHMKKWWETDFELFVKELLTKEKLGSVVQESNILLRHGIKELLESCHEMDIPLFIVSGGIREIIQATLIAIQMTDEIQCQNVQKFLNEVRIFSNEFIYDINGETVGYKEPIIHILNKREVIYQSELDFKKNVIVMGDILEDIEMVDSSKHEVVLKIGYFNNLKNHEDLFELFKKAYDIVIVDDGSMLPVSYILNKIFDQKITDETETLVSQIKGFDILKQSLV